MQRIEILLFLLVVSFSTVLQAQAPASAPKPDPQVEKLRPLVGHFTYEGEYKPGPWGPGVKITGEYDGQMTLRGFLFQARMVEKGPMGEMRALEIEEYNPATKNFTSNVYQDDGSRFSGTLTVDGNTFTWAGKFLVGGKEYQFKEPLVCTEDCISGTANGEISADGKTWAPFYEAKYTRAKAAPKK